MRNSLLILVLLFSFVCNAKSYKGTIYYKKDNKAVDVEIQMPIAVNAKKLKVIINGQKEKIDANTLAYFSLYLNDGEETVTFKRGKISHYKKNGNVRKAQNINVWSLITDRREHLVSSAAGLQYAIKKSKDKEYVLIVFNPWTQGLYLSKPDSDVLVATQPFIGETFESKVGGAKDLLFPECENLMERFAEAKKADKNAHEITLLMDLYETCLNDK